MFYGMVNNKHAHDYATAVCDVLGHGEHGKCVDLLIETAASETLLGEYRDPTERSAGSGITQVDESTFDWLKDKFKDRKEATSIKECFNITLALVTYVELNTSPLLAFIFARLRYRVVPDVIPADIFGRAEYWKKHYNSSEGKGSPEEYIQRARDCGLI